MLSFYHAHFRRIRIAALPRSSLKMPPIVLAGLIGAPMTTSSTTSMLLREDAIDRTGPSKYLSSIFCKSRRTIRHIGRTNGLTGGFQWNSFQ